MPITHATVATGTNAGTGEIHKEEWNADHVISGLGGGALVLLEQHTASSSASLDFASSISSDYDEYLVEFIQLVPATNAASILMRVSTNGGSSYDSGGNYKWAGWRASDVGSAVAGSNATTSFGLDCSGTQSNSATVGGLNGSMRIFNPLGGAEYTRFRWETGIDDGTGHPSVVVIGSGAYASTTAVNAFQVLMSSGNIASGTIRVYGVAPAVVAPTGGGLTLLEQHTASSSVTLDFTTFISSTYDEYLFELLNVIPATNDVTFQMRMGTGGGPTYDSGANYGWGTFVWRGGGHDNSGADSGQTFIGLSYAGGGTVGVSNSSNYGVCGQIRLFSPQSSIYKVINGEVGYLDAEPFHLGAMVDGTYRSTTVVTAIRFLFSSGNIASGTIRVYGIGK